MGTDEEIECTTYGSMGDFSPMRPHTHTMIRPSSYTPKQKNYSCKFVLICGQLNPIFPQAASFGSVHKQPGLSLPGRWGCLSMLAPPKKMHAPEHRVSLWGRRSRPLSVAFFLKKKQTGGRALFAPFGRAERRELGYHLSSLEKGNFFFISEEKRICFPKQMQIF